LRVVSEAAASRSTGGYGAADLQAADLMATDLVWPDGTRVATMRQGAEPGGTPYRRRCASPGRHRQYHIASRQYFDIAEIERGRLRSGLAQYSTIGSELLTVSPASS
jgi:hypothetical protein